MRKVLLTFMLAGAAAIGIVAPASAAPSAPLESTAPAGVLTGAEADFGIGYGTFRIKAWHCTTYWSACDWRSETMLVNNGGKYMDWIENRSTLEAHGISASVTISKNPEASLKMVSNKIGEVRWRRYVSNNTVTWGQMRPGGATTHVSVNSCGSGDGPGGYGYVTEKCVYAGAW